MSLRVRSSLALCTATALVFLGPGAAAAADDPAMTPADVVCDLVANPDGCGDEPADAALPATTTDDADADAAAGETQDPAQDAAVAPEGPAGTAPRTDALAGTGPADQSLDALGADTTTEETGSGETGSGETGSGETTGDEGEQPPASSAEDPDVEAALECLAAVGEEFVTEFVAQLEAVDPALAEDLAGIGSLEELVAFLEDGGLPLDEETLTGIVDETIAVLEAGSEDFQACLESLIPVAPPADGNPPPAQPVTNPAPQQPQYADCDDARAKGAAPVHAGQPGYGAHLDSDSDGIGCEQETAAVSYTSPTAAPKLAYTGFDVWPFAGAGAAMLVLGSVLVAAARRAG